MRGISWKISPDFFLELLFCSSVVLPTGSIYSINVKQPIFLMALLALAVRARHFGVTRMHAGVAILSGGVLFAWVPLAFLTGWSDGLLPFLQFKDIAVTAATAAMAAIYISDDAKRYRFVRIVIYSLGVTSAIKVAAFAWVVLTGASIRDVVAAIESVFGVELMGMDVGGAVGRLQFVSDAALPIALFCLMGRKDRFGIPLGLAVVLTGMLLFSVVGSFSRYTWAYAAIAVALSVFTAGLDRAKICYAILAAGVAVYFWNELSLLFEIRTSVEQVDSSDGMRGEQLGPLISMFQSAPLIGHGLGSYTLWVLRAADLRYSYEIQLLALLGQIGVVGVTAILLSLLFYFRGLWQFRDGYMATVAAALLIFLWIASGLFNPFLASSSAGVSFGFLYALVPVYLSKRNVSSVSTRPVRHKGGEVHLADI